MRTSLRKLGNSVGVIIPRPILQEIGAETGVQVELTVENGRVVISPVRQHPREGWAEAAAAIAAAGEDGLVWPEFGNIDDKSWTW